MNISGTPYIVFQTTSTMKVISFCVKLSPKKAMHRVEYPDLDKMIAAGYEIIDTLPAWGAANQYVITFLLQPPRKHRK